MEPQSERKPRKIFVEIDNFDKYDIIDCLDVLRYVKTFNAEDLQSDDFKKALMKLENRIDFLMQKINQ